MSPAMHDETLRALEANGWSLKAAAIDLGIAYDAMHARLRRAPDLRAAWEARFAPGGQGRRPRAHRITEDAVCEALRAHGGVMRRAARALGCSHESVRVWAVRCARVAALCSARVEKALAEREVCDG